MKIVIISDTHGDNDAIKNVYLREYDADCFLHAGDSEAPAEDIAPFSGVKGNCDISSYQYPNSRLIKTPYGLLKIQHYPLFDDSCYKSLKEENVKIFIHGHTHKKEDREVDGVKILCPGSLSFSRDDIVGSYLVLKLSENKIETIFKKR